LKPKQLSLAFRFGLFQHGDMPVDKASMQALKNILTEIDDQNADAPHDALDQRFQ
jgi:hypothetical protein